MGLEIGEDRLNMPQIKSWTVSDDLWCKVEPLIPIRKRKEGRKYQRKAGAGRKPMNARQVFSAIVYVLRTGCQWKAFRAHTVRPARCTSTSKSGIEPAFSRSSGRPGWPSMTACTASPGSGRPPTGPWEKLHWQPNVQVGTQPTGGKKGRKRSLLVDGRGLPLSIAVSGANVHDSKLLDRTLAQIVVRRPEVTPGTTSSIYVWMRAMSAIRSARSPASTATICA